MFITSFKRVTMQAQTIITNTKDVLTRSGVKAAKEYYAKQMPQFNAWCNDNVASTVNTSPVMDFMNVPAKRSSTDYMQALNNAEQRLINAYNNASK